MREQVLSQSQLFQNLFFRPAVLALMAYRNGQWILVLRIDDLEAETGN